MSHNIFNRFLVKKKWTVYLLAFLCLCLLLMFSLSIYGANNKKTAQELEHIHFKEAVCQKGIIQARIEDVLLNLEVACTMEQITRGLMFRKYLGENHGMIFLFDEPQVLNFWMKNTFVDLDIAFILDNTIKSIRPMEAQSQQIISSQTKVNIAIEVNRGFFQKHNIAPNSKVDFLL